MHLSPRLDLERPRRRSRSRSPPQRARLELRRGPRRQGSDHRSYSHLCKQAGPRQGPVGESYPRPAHIWTALGETDIVCPRAKSLATSPTKPPSPTSCSDLMPPIPVSSSAMLAPRRKPPTPSCLTLSACTPNSLRPKSSSPAPPTTAATPTCSRPSRPKRPSCSARSPSSRAMPTRRSRSSASVSARPTLIASLNRANSSRTAAAAVARPIRRGTTRR